MKIIAIEGCDKSGKHSATKMLVERLEAEGYKVVMSEHHRYDTPTGQLVMQWLQDKYQVSQETIELIMTADKQAQQEYYNRLETEGYDFLILDRYTLSQVVYAISNNINIDWVMELQRYMRKPDIDIVIDISAETSMSRKGKHNNGVNDKYESDLELLKVVRENYMLTPEKYSAPQKFIVNGEQDIELVHDDIYQIVLDNIVSEM